MSIILNGLYFAATMLFLGIVLVHTLRGPPLEGVRDNWPMRRFWVSDRLRHVTLLLTFVSALGCAFVVVAQASEADIAIFLPALMLGGMALLAMALGGLVYSLLLYRVSRADQEGF